MAYKFSDKKTQECWPISRTAFLQEKPQQWSILLYFSPYLLVNWPDTKLDNGEILQMPDIHVGEKNTKKLLLTAE